MAELDARIAHLEGHVIVLNTKLALYPLVHDGKYSQAVKFLNNTAKISPNRRQEIREFLNRTVLKERSREWGQHGISRSFRYYTAEEKKAYLEFCLEVKDVIAGFTPDVCLGFGTVLGIVRAGDLIPHDDDVDLIACVPNATDITDGVKILSDFLSQKGYNVTLSPGHFKVERPGAAALDVFPGYRVGDFVNWRPGPRDTLRHSDIFPPTPLIYQGLSCDAPRNPEKYLELVYGETWRTPRPAFRHVWDNFKDKIAK